jgi:hypothetical protein
MLKVEELQVLISANADQFHGELLKIQGELKDLNKSVSTASASIGGQFAGALVLIQGLAKAVTKTISVLVTSFVSLIRRVAALGSEYSRIKMATDTVTRNLGMTTAQVNNLRDSLADANTYGIAAEETIKSLAMSGLIDMAAELRAVDARSGEATQGVSALMLVMKDLAAAAGIDSVDGIQRLTRFIQRGEATFADGIIEIGNLNIEYRDFAARLNKTTRDLSAQELAQARLNIVMREGQKTFGAYANTMQTSGKTANSIRAILSNTAQIFGSFFELAMATGARAIFEFLAGVREAIIANEAVFKRWAMKVAAYIIVVVRILGVLLSKIPGIGRHFEGLRNFGVKPITVGATEAGESMDGFGSSMDDATQSANALKKSLRGLAAFDELNVLSKDPATEAGGAIGALALAPVSVGFDTSGFNESVDEINAMADDFFNDFREKVYAFKERIQPLLDFLAPVFEFLRDYKKELLIIAGIVGIAVVAFSGLLLTIGLVAGAFGLLSLSIGGIPIALILIAIGVFIAQFLAFTVVLLMVKSKVDEFINRFRNSINLLVLIASAAWSLVKQTALSVWDDIKAGIISRIMSIGLAIANIGGVVWPNIKNLINNTLISRIRAMQSIYNVMLSAIPGGFAFKTPLVPYLATGGIVTGPTLATIGEAGDEAVIPLENSRWMDELAAKIGGRGGAGSIVVKIGEDTIYERVADYINDRNLRMNTSVIKI